MDGSKNPEAASHTSHVKFEQRKSRGWSIESSSSDDKDDSPLGAKPQTKEMETEQMESESESRLEEEEKERQALLDRLKAETPKVEALKPKDRPGFQVTCAC